MEERFWKNMFFLNASFFVRLRGFFLWSKKYPWDATLFLTLRVIHYAWKNLVRRFPFGKNLSILDDERNACNEETIGGA